MLRARLVLLPCAAAVLAACSKEAPAEKLPIGNAAAEEARSSMAPEVRAALDSGNRLLRGGDANGAVSQYLVAAKADPQNAAPWYGVMMAANRLNNQKLADSATAMVNKLSAGAALSDEQMAKMHAEGTTALPEGHPAPGGGMPPAHPSIGGGMPGGHPPLGGPVDPVVPKPSGAKKTT